MRLPASAVSRRRRVARRRGSNARVDVPPLRDARSAGEGRAVRHRRVSARLRRVLRRRGEPPRDVQRFDRRRLVDGQLARRGAERAGRSVHARDPGDGRRVGASNAIAIVSSLSRALSARDEWDAVLALARDPAIELVISNTTEVGIVLDERRRVRRDAPPRSFPGKAHALSRRARRAFDYDAASRTGRSSVRADRATTATTLRELVRAARASLGDSARASSAGSTRA